MWVWIVIVALFLFLLGRTFQENGNSTRSGAAALIGTLFDGAALIALTLGVFGLLLSLVFGVVPETGPRLVGSSLYGVLTWSIGLLVAGMVLILFSVAVRRIGGQRRMAG